MTIMDIFEESLAGLGVEVRFDDNNLFQCELSNEEYDGVPLVLSARR
jgi:hypothetical protein